MDVILMIFGMSFVDNFTQPPQAPQAVVIDVAKYTPKPVSPDPQGDMWDPNWFNKENQ
jgi:hypothetical protein